MKADRAFDVVVFDLFGTLIENLLHSDLRTVLTRMASELGACPDDFIRSWESYRGARMSGKIGGMIDNVRCVCETMKISATDAQLKGNSR